jgi:hypothetical protein
MHATLTPGRPLGTHPATPLRPWTLAESLAQIRVEHMAGNPERPPHLEEVAASLGLSLEQARVIRSCYQAGDLPVCRMVERYKLSEAAIRRIGRSLCPAEEAVSYAAD